MKILRWPDSFKLIMKDSNPFVACFRKFNWLILCRACEQCCGSLRSRLELISLLMILTSFFSWTFLRKTFRVKGGESFYLINPSFQNLNCQSQAWKWKCKLEDRKTLVLLMKSTVFGKVLDSTESNFPDLKHCWKN